MEKEINFYIKNINNVTVTVLSTDKRGSHTPVLSAKVDEKLSSYDVLTLVIPADAIEAELIKEDYTIIFEDINGWREYIISGIEDTDGAVMERTITAELSSAELLDDILEVDITKTSNPATVLTSALANTRWYVGNVDASIYISSFTESTKYLSALEVINLISETFNCEVSFSYTIDQNKIAKRFVNLYKQMGSDNGKSFEIDKDVTEITRTVDTTGIKTAIIPYGKEPSEATEGVVQAKRLDIKNVVWTVAAGNPVNKPLGQSWLGDATALANWGKLNADGSRRHRFIALEIDTETTAELATMAWVNLGKYTDPSITYEAKVVDLYTLTGDEELRHEQVAIGDTVVVKDFYFAEPIAIKTRIVEISRDLIEPLNNELVLGDSKQSLKTDNVDRAVEELKTNVAKANYNATTSLVNGTGNTTFYGSITSNDPDEGDTWFRPHPTKAGETQLLVYNGTIWEVVSDTSELEMVKEEVQAAVAATAETIIVANNAVSKVDQAIEDAGFIKLDVNQVKLDAIVTAGTAQAALSNSGTAITNAQIALDAYDSLEIGGRNLIANSRYLKLYGNSAGWGNSVLRTDESTPYYHVTGTSFISTYEPVIHDWMNANCVIGNSYTIGVDVRIPTVGVVQFDTGMGVTLIEKASVWTRIFHTFKYSSGYYPSGLVFNDGNELDYRDWKLETGNQGTAWSPSPEDVQVQITDINGELSRKVAQTSFNTLQGTVTSQSTLISQSQTAIGLKADSSFVNTVKGTVDTHSNQIKVTSDGLALKAESSLVNTLKGTVDTHSNQISANSTAITARLTSSQVDTLVSGKNYVNETALSATASGLNASITEVSTDLDNIEIGGRNLLPNTKGMHVSDYPTFYSITSSKNIYMDTKVPSGYFMRLANITMGGGSSFYLHPLNSFSENLSGVTILMSIYLRGNIPFTFRDNLIGTEWTKVTVPTKFGTVNYHWYFSDPNVTQIDVSSIKIERGNKATDWSPAPEDMATLEKFTTLNATVDGIQTTVGTKASQTQVTQLAGQITTKVESSTYNSKMTQLDSAINLRVQSSKVISQINLSTEGILLQGKRIQLDGDVTMTTAFIGQIKAIDIAADRITAGTLNAANVNIINLNANKIATGSITGANSYWNLNTGVQTFTNPSNGDLLTLTQGEIMFQNGSQGRLLEYNAEGLQLKPASGNTGTSNNTALHLIGGGSGSYQYIQFLSSESGGISQRVQAEGNSLSLMHSTGGLLLVKVYGGDNYSGIVRAARYETAIASGNNLEIQGDQIRTPRDGSRNIFITPQGTGAVIAGASGGTRYNVNASDFVKQSTRDSKTDIKPIETKGLDVISRLLPVSYKKKDKVANGIIETELGFIAEDSLEVATVDGLGIYDSHITAYLVKAVQELNDKVNTIGGM